MIASSAVKILDLKQNKEIIIPCHRHCNAFFILHEFGYGKKDFKVIEQGYLDSHDNFLNRSQAFNHALDCKQIHRLYEGELFSEDLW